MSLPFVQLSCQQCTRRKTRCNKEVPCSACVSAGISCSAVRRHRLPRGRSGNSRASKHLTERIHHLEEIVSRLQQESKVTKRDSEHNGDLHHERAPSSTNIDSYVASSFWLQLTDAVSELKEVIETGEDNNSDQEDESLLQKNQPQESNDLGPSLSDAQALLFEADTPDLTLPTSDLHSIPTKVQQFLPEAGGIGAAIG